MEAEADLQQHLRAKAALATTPSVSSTTHATSTSVSKATSVILEWLATCATRQTDSSVTEIRMASAEGISADNSAHTTIPTIMRVTLEAKTGRAGCKVPLIFRALHNWRVRLRQTARLRPRLKSPSMVRCSSSSKTGSVCRSHN